MENINFNKAITKIFAMTSQDDELVNLVTRFWIMNELTDRQVMLLDALKDDASNGLASCAMRYFTVGSNDEP